MHIQSFSFNRKLALVAGLALGCGTALAIQSGNLANLFTSPAYETDFQLAINGELVEPFSSSTAYPADETTLASFLLQNGFALMPECIGDQTGTVHCADEANVFRLYVDGELAETPFHHFVGAGDEHLLLYHGPDNSAIIDQLLTS